MLVSSRGNYHCKVGAYPSLMVVGVVDVTPFVLPSACHLGHFILDNAYSFGHEGGGVNYFFTMRSFQ